MTLVYWIYGSFNKCCRCQYISVNLMQVVILFLMRFPSSIQLWKMGRSSVEHTVHLPDADVVEALPLNSLAMVWRHALRWALIMPWTDKTVEAHIGKSKKSFFRSFVLIVDLNYNFISCSLNCAIAADAKFQLDSMELQQLRSKETFSLPPHCLQNVSLNDPSGEGSILSYAHGLWWNRSSAERPGQRRWQCPLVPWCTPSLSGHEACSRKAAVEDVRGRCDTGWKTMWAFASPEKVRWGFGEVLARSVFVFSGLSSGPGVAVGSLLMHQRLALPLCPGTSRDVRLHTGALASHCPLPGQCVWPKVCQVPRQLSVAFSLWKRTFQATSSSQGHCPSARLLCSQNILHFYMVQPSRQLLFQL